MAGTTGIECLTKLMHELEFENRTWCIGDERETSSWISLLVVFGALDCNQKFESIEQSKTLHVRCHGEDQIHPSLSFSCVPMTNN